MSVGKVSGVFNERMNMAISMIGISHRELSNLSGLTVVCIWLLSKGKTYPTIDTAEKIAASLGVDPAWMVGWSDEASWKAKGYENENLFPYGVG